MSLVRTRSFLSLLAAAALAASLSACNGDDDPAGNDDEVSIVGSWQATSFTALGSDFIDDGMRLSATFEEDNTYEFVVINDLVGVCGGEGGESCTTTGAYATSAGQVTIDAGEEDEVTFAYTVQGSVMTWTGSIDGIPATLTFARAG